MLGKFKTFFSQWLPFNPQNQGVKRERDSPTDEPISDSSSSITHTSGSISKKLRLAEQNYDSENHNPAMAGPSGSKSKKDLESYRNQKWSQILAPPSSLSSIPVDKPDSKLFATQAGAQHSVKGKNHIVSNGTSNEKKSFFSSNSIHYKGSDIIEEGLSLVKLEKLASNLGDAAIPNTETGGFKLPDTIPNFNFAPMAVNGFTAVKDTSAAKGSPVRLKGYPKKSLWTGGNGIGHKPHFKPIHNKLFGSPKKAKSTALMLSSGHPYFVGKTVDNCIRMEEKLSYKALLSQFAPRNWTSRAVQTPTSSSPILSSSRSSSGIFLDKLDYKESSLVQQEIKNKSRVVIDLENELSQVVYQYPIPATKPVVRVNSLEDALSQSPFSDLKLVTKLHSRYGPKERERQREINETTIRKKIQNENDGEWEKIIEERLRIQLEIAPKPVLDERVKLVVKLPEITDEMENVIEKALNGPGENQVLCDAFSLTITRKDLKTLAGLNWLNDQVINFYLTLVMERSSGSSDFPKVHAFNTFFYPKLMSGGHSGLKRWTRKIDLFQQDFILVPVHLGLHWCLAIVAPKDKTIRYYDSMGGQNYACLDGLRSYMEAESLDKRKQALDTSDWVLECVEDIPQQMNGSDCGMFACKFAEYVARRADITFDQNDMPYFRRRMVYEIINRKLIHP